MIIFFYYLIYFIYLLNCTELVRNGLKYRQGRSYIFRWTRRPKNIIKSLNDLIWIQDSNSTHQRSSNRCDYSIKSEEQIMSWIRLLHSFSSSCFSCFKLLNEVDTETREILITICCFLQNVAQGNSPPLH